MVQALYFALLVISVAYLGILLTKFKRHISVYYILLAVSVVVVNLGFMQMAGAKSEEAALLGNLTTCLATPFTLFFDIATIANLCKTRIPTPIRVLSIVIGCALFLCALSVGHVDWYYRDVHLIEFDGYSFLQKSYGPLHKLYPAYITFMMLYGLWIVVGAMRRRDRVSHFVSVGSLALLLIACAVYMGERVVGLKIELMPIAYVICLGGILLMLNRVVTYDVSGISRDSIDESNEYGFVVCDSKFRFCSADDQARQWFPELDGLKIDYRIEDLSTDFLRQLRDWVVEGDEDPLAHFERDKKSIEVQHTVPAEHDGDLHCIRMRDDTRQQLYLRLMENYSSELEEQVNEKTAQLEKVQNDIVVGMASIVENRDGNTGGHIQRTSDVVRVFVAHLMDEGDVPGLTRDVAQCVVKAAPLHDFGKVGIPDAVLNKPGKFTPEEYEIMKQHAEKGAVIVAQILQNSDDALLKTIAVNVAHYHHEKWNGTGYPCGLAGEEIPLEARIMALADVFDALVSKRVYKERFGYEKAWSIIEESSGSHFDPVLCAKFVECRQRIEALYDAYED